MADANQLFQELQDDLKQQRMHELWRKVGPWLIGSALTIVLATASVVGWKAYNEHLAEQRTTALMAALAEKDGTKQEAALGAFAAAHPNTPQAALAQLEQAGLEQENGEPEDALKLYTDLATKPQAPEALRALARIAATHLAAQLHAPALPPAVMKDTAFAPLQKEADAWKLYGDGKKDDARAAFQQLSEDVSAPPSVRARAAEVAAYLAP